MVKEPINSHYRYYCISDVLEQELGDTSNLFNQLKKDRMH